MEKDRLSEDSFFLLTFSTILDEF
jgi:hypothetical protein